MKSEKMALRARFVSMRASWETADRALRSAAIVDRLLGLDELAHARTVLAFWPMIDRFEVDIRPAIEILHARGICVGLPVISGTAGSKTMEFRPFDGTEHLETGVFGTFQPGGGPSIPPREADLILVPALAVDPLGYRLGWGAGYYDRLLATVDRPTVCPIFEACLVDSLVTETHDRAVALIVTEDRTLSTGQTP